MAEGLKDAGYATSSEYVASLKSAMDAWGLRRFDGMSLEDFRSGAANGDAIVAAAMGQLGVPYVWGGTTPGVGLDCSGLTQYCYAQAGISIPRNSEAQAAAGRRVPLSEAKPGTSCGGPATSPSTRAATSTSTSPTPGTSAGARAASPTSRAPSDSDRQGENMQKKNKVMLAAAIGMVAVIIGSTAVRCSIAHTVEESAGSEPQAATRASRRMPAAPTSRAHRPPRTSPQRSRRCSRATCGRRRAHPRGPSSSATAPSWRATGHRSSSPFSTSRRPARATARSTSTSTSCARAIPAPPPPRSSWRRPTASSPWRATPSRWGRATCRASPQARPWACPGSPSPTRAS